jgi:hypothetical protein
VRVFSSVANQRLTLRGVDDRGRELIGEAEDPRAIAGGQEYDFRLRLPPDARTVDLTFGIDTTRYVEFVAKPLLVVAARSAARAR